MTDSPDPYDHFQAMATAPVETGVYRVVGTSDGASASKWVKAAVGLFR